MVRLYNLRADYDALMERVEAYAAEHEGEITPELGAELDAIAGAVEEKVHNCGMAYKNIMAEAEALREEERKLAARRKVAESRAEWLKAYIAANVPVGAKYEFPQVTIKFIRSSAVDVLCADDLPDEYKKIKVDFDKAGIKQAFARGERVRGAMLIERQNINIR